ncbi:c-type cytochrome biogenesis protein CcmI [Testudinibacter sp. TR-2022]|uniref:c-type cytochrome biogenesis protein CcmI n=1 Tax=Testudinibacter sp. TR-2022 TaxID=2585029 RepID=UPI0011191F4B|nr:c-type cytochrome biogenesis protein CcmI [Testudinibacter sp. TR-2022]TNH02023.1 c-type cytochrome biogenesis protein CcmI [Pasteurellaceae bacterium Phil31]TNH09958.1 c-type cytochrome biogenesis protein CcmI [Testudinibacter sp. TR-2022]TNH12416.1 c-type cytochrome biogenesis protein CcmI [Testudinibacter sp. TR-2022]TNH16237.1 c-type cytochrome biogenesis protein CcmI [Testudinibacter sp. TR-2022]TNH19253.1 c-type cytochrome biogenesis protein CcmI [Testudinibacter sp. TR-2022]
MMLWLVFLLLTLITALLAFYPLLLKNKNKSAVQQQDLNRAFYYDRLQELKQDNEQGLLDDPQQSESELQQRLLNDIPLQHAETQNSRLKNGKIWFTSGTLALTAIALVTYFSVGSWHGESMLENAHAQLPHLQQRLAQEQQQPLTTEELQQFTIALRAELQQAPDNDKNWWLLGQIGMAAGNGQLALDSYKRATALAPENTEYKLSYARVLMFSQDENDKTRGELLLREVIKQDHNNVQALSLLAFSAFEKEDYKMALMSWEMMLRQLPPDDERIPLIQRSMSHAIAELKAQEQPPAANP